MKHSWRLFLIMLALSACASGSTKVILPKTTTAIFSTAQIQHSQDAVSVPADITQRFESKLKELLFVSDGFQPGTDLTVAYRFIEYDPGSRLRRYMIGFGAGKGEVTVEMSFKDAAGNELAKIENGGEISMGFFGGSIDQAIDEMAKKSAAYANANFRAPKPGGKS